jgi:RNA polymerase sigma-70 factor (ECF subfamily)
MIATCSITNQSLESSGHRACSRAGQIDHLAQLQAGDAKAFEALVHDHSPRMLATARRFFHCEADAADAVQDALLAAFKAIRRFKGDSQLGTWLHRIVVNSCLMNRRSRDRRPTVAVDERFSRRCNVSHHEALSGASADSPSEVVSAAELRRQVRQCINRLPELYREVLLLRDIEEFDTELTARLLDVSPGVVKTRLHRARRALRVLLEPPASVV